MRLENWLVRSINIKMVYTISKNTLGLIVNLYVKKIKGLENVPKKGPYIIAANHSSYMDHLILQNMMARKFNLVLHFLAKVEHFKGSQKLWHKHFKAIPLDRDKGGKDALGKAIEFLKKGQEFKKIEPANFADIKTSLADSRISCRHILEKEAINA